MLVSADGVSDISWVPFDDFQLGELLRLMMLLQFLLDLFFGEFIKAHNLLHEFFIIELVTEGFVIGEGRIDSEDYGQFLFHHGPKLFKLLLIKTKMKSIVLSEDFVIFRD